MDILGHPAGPVRPPLGTLSARDRTDLQALLERLGVPTASERTASRLSPAGHDQLIQGPKHGFGGDRQVKYARTNGVRHCVGDGRRHGANC